MTHDKLALLNSYQVYAEERIKSNLLRKLPLVISSDEKPSDLIDFSSSDYLKLSKHPLITQTAAKAAAFYGVSGLSSRVLNTSIDLYQELEELLRTTLAMPAALLFISGWQANTSCLPALLNKEVLGAEPLVFCDRLNHASLHQGCKLAAAQEIRYRHCDLNHLADLLKTYRQSSRPKFIITETVFSMDGDGPDLKELLNLAITEGAFLYLDDAHAVGVLGPDGYGLGQGIPPEHGVIMGTFSKGVGTSGAYVAGDNDLIQYLVNSAGGLIYSTAPSPVVIAATIAAWTLLPSFGQQREQMLANARSLRTQLAADRWNTGQSTSHIIPLIVSESETALHLQEHLWENHIHAAAIRAPSVAPGTARLRLACHSGLITDDYQRLLSALSTFEPNILAATGS